MRTRAAEHLKWSGLFICQQKQQYGISQCPCKKYSSAPSHTITGKMMAKKVDLRIQSTARQMIWISVNRWTLLRGTWRRKEKSGWCLEGIMYNLILSQNCGGQRWMEERSTRCKWHRLITARPPIWKINPQLNQGDMSTSLQESYRHLLQHKLTKLWAIHLWHHLNAHVKSLL